ncbi:aminotransferase [Jannaschia sp. W003]|uniref:aminotransferase n=1 Tax=Jannaschia sp. W003 TaxID=2867012 RepID=UPI0021A59119|nr:aminotransferase [Jannaschia sp. W003]UWQ20411.1 aminotransferase [Jannaschia sp. W003]
MSRPHPLNPALAATIPPPVMEARRWLDGVAFPEDRPLLNLSQAAPADPPPEGLRREIARLAVDVPEAHLYGPVLGLPALRERLAADWSAHYGGTARPAQVAITAGCNQAFAAAVSTLAARGDNVVVPTPYYFNHAMWLAMEGIEARLHETGQDLLPDPEAVAAAIDDRTRAILLVTPNNPGGVEYPAALVAAFRDLARACGIALILDETYRDFHAAEGAPHALLEDPDWDRTVIQLFSFSKSYRLTGHRVGAIVAAADRLREAEKWLDTVTICPAQLGQHAALWGMENLGDWLAGERREILARRRAMDAGFRDLAEWEVLGCGAYFAYVRHPFPERSDALCRRLVRDAGLLLLPGTMFGPLREAGGSGRAEATLRIAYANADLGGIEELFRRLRDVAPA